MFHVKHSRRNARKRVFSCSSAFRAQARFVRKRVSCASAFRAQARFVRKCISHMTVFSRAFKPIRALAVSFPAGPFLFSFLLPD